MSRSNRFSMKTALFKIGLTVCALALIRVFFFSLSENEAVFTLYGKAFAQTIINSELGTEPSGAFREELSLFSSYTEPSTHQEEPELSLAPDDGFNGIFIRQTPTDSYPEGQVSSDDEGPLTGEAGAEEYFGSSDPFSSIDHDPAIKTITIAPSSTKGYDYADGVYIKNDTGESIDVRSYLDALPVLGLKENQPVVLIVHTHGSESYYPDGADQYTPTDPNRTEDKQYNMIRIGDEVAKLLEERGYASVHLREIFDYPSYAGSYTRTLTAINQALKENPSIRIVLDLHRDAMVSAAGATYRTVAEIDGQKAAQLMIVVGTNGGGLKHPDWRKNLTFAIHLQKQLLEDHPMLMRPINLRNERFNQHVTNRALLIEFGSSGNTLQEALYSARLFVSSLATLLDVLA